jgi:AcrR family transcriptional regulator
MKIKTRTKKKTLIEKKHYLIAQAAIPLFEKKGFNQTSIREIADAADISVGLLYKYISTKDDILFLAYKELSDRNFDALSTLNLQKLKTPIKKLRASMEALIKLVDEDPKKFLFLYTESKFLNRAALKDVLGDEFRTIEHFKKIIEEGIRKKLFADHDPFFSATVIVYLIMLGPMRGWSYQAKYSQRVARENLIDFCLKSLLKKESVSGASEKIVAFTPHKERFNGREDTQRLPKMGSLK